VVRRCPSTLSDKADGPWRPLPPPLYPVHPHTQPNTEPPPATNEKHKPTTTKINPNRLRLDPQKLGDFNGSDLGRLLLGLAKMKHPVRANKYKYYIIDYIYVCNICLSSVHVYTPKY
jgi:hypothetical protein